MDEHHKSMNYLMVNPEDYLPPWGARRNRLSRSVSPVFTNFVACDDGSDSLQAFRIYSSTKSLHLLDKHSSSDSSANTSLKLHKSSEHLVISKAKKKLHRRAHVSEVYRPRCYTEPGLKKPEERKLVVPILTIPGTSTMSPAPMKRRRHISGGSSSSALSSLIEQTLKVTTASMGLKAGSEDKLSQHSSKPLDEDVKRRFSRSTSSVSTLAYATPDTSMAPLQSHTEAQSVTCLNTLDKDTSPTQQQQQQPQHKRHYCQQLSTSGSTQSGYSSANSSVNESYQNLTNLGNSKAETRSLRHNSNSLNPLVPVASSASIRSASSTSSTAKHEQSSAAAAAAASTSTTPPEKEKKRKEVSSSRVKKFHRHFSQVSKDEKLINYFSCALVSDILLQGHLYITDQHFAFYSNVFGYVTKVVIPTSSVTKISKEKTAKIIPNAVGVATVDERHVFGSFISREAAFRLMCSVCPPLAPADIILPKAPADIEISEEYSIEDDSSCSISGNESPPQTAEGGAGAAGTLKSGDTSQNLLRRSMAGSSLSIPEGKVVGNDKLRHSDIPSNAKSATASTQHTNAGAAPSAAFYINHNNSKSSPPTPLQGLPINKSIHLSLLTTPTTGAAASAASNLTMIIAGTASSTSASSSPTPSSSSSPTTVVVGSKPKSAVRAATDSFRTLSKKALLRLKFPTELHVVYMGVMLAVILALFSVFLLYRILDIEAKTSLYRPVEFNWRSGDDEDIFAEALRWQKELQTKSTEEAQSILNTNLEQIAKVRRSLETLSLLIHDRSSAYATTNRDDSD